MFHGSIALGIIALSWYDSCYLLPLKGSCASIVLALVLLGLKEISFGITRTLSLSRLTFWIFCLHHGV